MGAHAIGRREGELEAPRRVLDSIRLIVHALRLFDRAVEKQFGISGAQAFVLEKLRDGAAVSINEISQRTHTHQSSVSVVVQKLVQRKLLSRRRSAKDARQMQIRITARGRAILDGSPQAAQDRLIGAVRRLPAMQQSMLAEALERVVADMGASGQLPMLFFEERNHPALPSGSASKRRRASGGVSAIHA